MKTQVMEAAHLLFVELNERLKERIMLVGPATIKVDNKAELIEHKTQLASYNPASVALAFAPDLKL